MTFHAILKGFVLFRNGRQIPTESRAARSLIDKAPGR